MSAPAKSYPYNQWCPAARALDLVGDKWTLLIVRDLATGPRRFTELARVLPGVSLDTLQVRLSRMVADGLVTRTRYNEAPPRVDYELTDAGRGLLPVLGALARWGQAWAWGAPRRGEQVDIGSLFRLAPGLIEPDGASGTVEFAVERRGQRRCYSCRVEAGAVTVEERESDAPDARVTGKSADWIRVLSAAAESGSLKVTGDRALAEALLDGFTPSG